MSDAPERIRVAQDADGFWTCREAVSGSQEYVRADLYAALDAQLAGLGAENERLKEALRLIESAKELPPLPKASKMYDIPGYDEEELKDYARAAILADRADKLGKLAATLAEKDKELAALKEALTAIDKIITSSIQENGQPNRLKIGDVWHIGPAVDALHSILMGLRMVARSALTAGGGDASQNEKGK